MTHGDLSMKRIILGASLFGLMVLFGGGAFIVSGAYAIGADVPHWNITSKVLEAARDRAIAVRARDIKVPDLADEQLILKGAGQYAAMCVGCHLAPGKSDSEIRPGLYPQPPNLSQTKLDPRTVFWVTKHGLKMTAMPAWGLGHDDDTIWSIVAFVQKLPGMSPQDYKDIVAKAPPDEEMGSMDQGGGGNQHQHGSEPHQHGTKPEPSKGVGQQP